MSESVWLVDYCGGTVALRVGQRFRFDSVPEIEWEIAFPPNGEIDDGEGNVTPTFPCHQRNGDPMLYPADRKENGMIDMCGDAIATAVALPVEPPS